MTTILLGRSIPQQIRKVQICKTWPKTEIGLRQDKFFDELRKKKFRLGRIKRKLKNESRNSFPFLNSK